MPLIRTEKTRSFRHPRKYKYGRGFTWNPPIDFARFDTPPQDPAIADTQHSEQDSLPDTPGRSDSSGSEAPVEGDSQGGFPDEHVQSIPEIVMEIGGNFDQYRFITDQLINVIIMKLEGILELVGV